MAHYQHAFTLSADAVQQLSLKTETRKIELEHVYVSQLLGRAYIFIDNKAAKLAIHNSVAIYALLDELIQKLALAEGFSVAITVDDSTGTPCFTRHDLTWHKHKICRLESTVVTHPEQHEFMDMIWQCSTSALPA